MKKWVSGGPILVLVACVMFLVVDAKPAAAATLPAGFEDQLVTSVSAPTAAAFTPDGRALVTSQPGRLYVHTGTNPSTVALDISARTCSGQTEDGLLGVDVDPDFATNNFIYVYNTINKSGNCFNRVSRFTLPVNNTIDVSSELVLIDNIPSPSCCHNGGDVQFGKDGNLYVSVGDGAIQSGTLAQNPGSLLGKILRIDPSATGSDIPAGNPYTGAGSQRCNAAGGAAAGRQCQEVFALGLRNPFRMAFDPNATGTRFFINDVGQNTWEEVDEGVAGANYGWPSREGPCAQGSVTNCGAAGFTPPVHSYPHSSGCRSITGGAFVPDGLWTGYDGAYLYADFVCGGIFSLAPKSGGGFTETVFAGCLDKFGPSSMVFGPSGASRALYYTTYANGGQLRRIEQTGATGTQPACSQAPPSQAIPRAPTPPAPPAATNTSRPVILSPRPAPGAKIGDRTPRVTAVVRDAQTNLGKSNIRFYFDGRRKRTFSYNVAKNRLSFVTSRLSAGRHRVKVVAADGQGKSNARNWSFVVRN